MKALLPVALLLAAALAGCAGDSNSPTTPERDADGNYVIHLKSNHFNPANAQVPLNATVKWVDDDGVHDVTAGDGSWSSDMAGMGLGHKMQAGDTFQKQFLTAGTYSYECTIHASTGMKGTLKVG